jgi:hypothetical protein
MKMAGSRSGSISQRRGCGYTQSNTDPLVSGVDPDPHQNVTDPQHCFVLITYPCSNVSGVQSHRAAFTRPGLESQLIAQAHPELLGKVCQT